MPADYLPLLAELIGEPRIRALQPIYPPLKTRPDIKPKPVSRLPAAARSTAVPLMTAVAAQNAAGYKAEVGVTFARRGSRHVRAKKIKF